MSHSTRLRLLIFLGISVFLFIILSAGLPQLRLQPGQAFSLGLITGEKAFPSPDTIETKNDLWVRGLVGLAVVALIIYVITSLTTPQGRRRLLVNLIQAALLWLVLIIIKGVSHPPVEPSPDEVLPNPLAPPGAGTLPPIATFIPDSPAWFDPLVFVVIAVIIAAIVAGVIWYIYRRKQPKNALELIAEQAQSAVTALKAGADFKNTIIRCYARMCQILSEERGIHRHSDMTTSEFKMMLEEKGFPSSPIEKLTHLFEDIRYGNVQFGATEEQTALDCLTAVVIHCRS